MSSILLTWLQFVALAFLIGFAGFRLSNYADEIAEKTGLGRGWVGLILLATVTSLPELMTGISAVRFAEDPNLAVGDILGSCAFNLALVFLLDLLYREGTIYRRITQGHVLAGALGMILVSFVGFSLMVANYFPEFSVGHVGGYAAIVPVFYVLSMRMLYSFEKDSPRKIVDKFTTEERDSLINAYVFFGLAAIIVVGAGAVLPFVGGKILLQMGWNASFVGTIFIAFATSVPEIAVTISAVRLRAPELAFSNLLGSNLFNVAILAIDDIAYTKGLLFRSVSSTHIITAFSVVMMTGMVVIALIQPPARRLFNTVSVMSLLLLFVYFLNAYLAFKIG